ncbi:ABC transporter permease [Nocardia altamirensis]|uniref:ABC transporter permease n=1 Tax=Nocardia altamirensis TaxID=472158 RepID=UPI00083FDBE5|nr:ABC transporter permease [Nocardia altamirensis]
MSLLTVASRPRIGTIGPGWTGTIAQWWVLTVRLIRPSWRNGELVTAVLAPVVFTLGFYVPLNLVMSGYGHGLSSYAQFLLPMIVMQAVAFCATSAAFRAATDARDGLTVRFGALPMPAAVPLAARITAALYRAVVSLAMALVCGRLIGAEFYGSAWDTVGFVAFSVLVTVALCLGADLIGSVTGNPEAITQVLVFPQVILGLVSTGLAPASQFPSWLQGFARNQPVSQFVYGLRALAGDSSGNAGVVGWAVLGPGLAWAVGMVLVFGALGAVVAMRRSG